MRRLLIPFIALFCVLTACDQDAAFERFVPKEETAKAKDVIAKLAARNYPAVEAELDPSLRTPDVRSKLEQASASIPNTAPKSIRVVGAQINSVKSVKNHDLTFEYEYEDTWLVISTVLQRRGENLTFLGIHLTPRASSLEAENRFTLAGKSGLHFLVIAFVVIIPLVIVYALIACVRTRGLRRKWLWLFFVAIGIVHIQFNWTTGALAVNPLSFALLGAGLFKAGPAAPLIFTFAFLLGAILFLLKRRSAAQLPAA